MSIFKMKPSECNYWLAESVLTAFDAWLDLQIYCWVGLSCKGRASALCSAKSLRLSRWCQFSKQSLTNAVIDKLSLFLQFLILHSTCRYTAESVSALGSANSLQLSRWSQFSKQSLTNGVFDKLSSFLQLLTLDSTCRYSISVSVSAAKVRSQWFAQLKVCGYRADVNFQNEA